MSTTVLELRQLHVSYGGIKAVRGIDLHVEKAELVCLIGANGAGKSTTLKAICGLVPASKDSIYYDGRCIVGTPPFQLVRQGLAMVPEGRGVFGQLTIEENLAMGAYVRNDAAKIRSDVEHVFALFPRLFERRDQIAGYMSGGEQQMLAIGRALMLNPKLLLLDEPFEGLAPNLVAELEHAIDLMMAEGLAAVLVEQHVEAALRLSETAIVLEHGRVVHAGSSAGLRDDRALLERLVTLRAD